MFSEIADSTSVGRDNVNGPGGDVVVVIDTMAASGGESEGTAGLTRIGPVLSITPVLLGSSEEIARVMVILAC